MKGDSPRSGQAHLSFEDQVFALPVLEHLQGLQGAHDVHGVHCGLLADLCKAEPGSEPTPEPRKQPQTPGLPPRVLCDSLRNVG